MSVVVFLGPTLPAPEAGAIIDARLLPPARFGDVYRAAVALNARTIALIDGYFNQEPSVWHKEILWVLSRGVRVLGAASMGALRAAELCQFGMEGVGTVFNAYREGRFPPYDDDFDGDDEVAVTHGPAELGYRRVSEALVDIRATLAAAARAGVIDVSVRDRLVTLSRRRFYADRTFEALLEDARTLDGASPHGIEALASWIARHKSSVKRDDAIRLLEQLAGHGPAWRPSSSFRFEHTTLWDNALRVLNQPPPAASPVLDELRLLGPGFFDLRDVVLEALRGEPDHAGVVEPDLSPDETWYGEPLQQASMASFLRAAPDRWVAHRMLARLARTGELDGLRRRAGDKADKLRGRTARAADLDELGRLQLMDWYFSELLGREMPADIEAYAASLGMPGADAFEDLVLREYLYCHRDE